MFVFYWKYLNFCLFLAVKATIIYPATEKHIVKYSVQKLYIVDESPTVYNEIVLPHILSEQLSLQVFQVNY